MGSFNSKSIFQFASKSDIIKIIVTIILVFVMLQFIRISMLLTKQDVAFYFDYIWNPLSLAASFKAFIKQPWSIFTFLFIDESLMRIIGNMIWLWIFGTVIEDLKGPARVLPVFITGGLIGGLFLLVFNAIMPAPTLFYTGSTAGVMAVAFAALMFKPQYRFWWFLGIGIPIWVFVLIFMAFQLASIQLSNLPYLFLLLGGIISGLLYTNILATYYEHFTTLIKRLGNLLDNRNFVIQNTKPAPQAQVPFKRIQFTPKGIDDILDKIHAKGIDSLTKDERRLLDEYSERNK
ncbi:MAG: rhomboid family intramembrane serine protease [Bacteroidetes bacterium]|nr:rhomboid family intramembrane serine protease [Bacteroidota bacterium]